ncbi:hypothetical protein VOWphi5012_043 [Vibrio phage phi50-12]|uniref:Uncharacterized protein n=1 Tax=Vibrio phage phi50-12 TaxID=2654972 RepID=A0A5P8PRA8_9CAUD|nr:hypothetical protein KNU82_gp043 [Vibrio phage phi50-12]QFR59827.1 hypothetical protein VOWphi5012_043 [Vibrio phage phi50-12]
MKHNEVYFNAKEVAQQILDDMGEEERKNTKEVKLYKGIVKEQSFAQFLCVDQFLEQMSESAYETGGEWAEDYLDNVTESQKEDLVKVILAWSEKHNIKPSWFMVEEIEEVKFTIPSDWE